MDSLLLVLLLMLLGLAQVAAAVPASVSLTIPPLMLAQVLDDVIDPGSYLVSEKLDGVRAYWNGQHLYTRSGRQIHAPDWFLAGFPTQSLDGELWAGRGQFELASSVVRTTEFEHSGWQQLSYRVFDLPQSPEPFESRHQQLQRLIDGIDSGWIESVEQWQLTSESELSQRLDEIAAAGGEGLMLHRRTALYEEGERSPHLLKYKQHQDDEAVVIGYTPGKGKYEGMTGSLLVQTPDGRRFGLGSGLSDDERINPPAIGAVVTYQFNGYTSTGLPRFARFLRVRHDD